MEAVQLAHYCGKLLPGPQLSDERSTAMRVIFNSNAQSIRTGFRAKYEFIAKKPVSKRTLRNVNFSIGFNAAVKTAVRLLSTAIRRAFDDRLRSLRSQ